MLVHVRSAPSNLRLSFSVVNVLGTSSNTTNGPIGQNPLQFDVDDSRALRSFFLHSIYLNSSHPMPLPPPALRHPIHERLIEMQGCARSDDLFDIPVHLTDLKPVPFAAPAGVHVLARDVPTTYGFA